MRNEAVKRVEELRLELTLKECNLIKLRDELISSEAATASARAHSAQLQSQVVTLGSQVTALTQTNAELSTQTHLFTDSIGVDRLLSDQGLLLRSDAERGVTRYVKDPNQIFRDEGFSLREEGLQPVETVYTLLHSTGKVIDEKSGGCVGTTTFAVAHDYYTRNNQNDDEHRTRALLSNKYGGEAAMGCYMAHQLHEALSADAESPGFDVKVISHDISMGQSIE